MTPGLYMLPHQDQFEGGCELARGADRSNAMIVSAAPAP
jgi:hypothetical protein